MVVAVNVERKLAGDARSEQLRECGVLYDLLSPTLAADMAVEADNTIRLRHHDMQIVADQQNSAAEFVTDLRDQVIERGFAGDIHTGQRLVENKKLRTPCDRTRQQNTRKLPARKCRHLPGTQAGHVHTLERAAHKRFGSE